MGCCPVSKAKIHVSETIEDTCNYSYTNMEDNDQTVCVAGQNVDQNIVPITDDGQIKTVDSGTNDNQNLKNEGTFEENKLMTEEELKNFREKTYEHLRNTMEEVLALDTKMDDDGAFVVKIRNAILRYSQSYFLLKRTTLEEIVKYRLGIAEVIIKSKILDLATEIIRTTIYQKGWKTEEGKTNQKLYSPFCHCLLFILNYTDCSDELAVAVTNMPGLLEAVKQILLDSIDPHLKQEHKADEEKIMKYCMSIIHNCSMRETNISRLRSLGFTDVLQPYLHSTNKLYCMTALASLAGIVNEQECEIINANQDVVKHLLNVLSTGLKVQERRYSGWSCKECALTVRQLARNDANKKLLVELGALEPLVQLGKTGNLKEQQESIEAIWILCFDKDNRQKIVSSQDLGVVDLLLELMETNNNEVKKACNGALWTLRDDLVTSSIATYKTAGKRLATHHDKTLKFQAQHSEGHIMISYQWADQQVLKMIKDKIKKEGYKVWMDIDEISGSTLQAMAEAIEKSKVVLVCMSQKYKNSPNCRAEAEYAFLLKKHIIPLKMERGYVPDGWLGLICGAQLFFDFSGKYPFEEKFGGLLKELSMKDLVTEDTSNMKDMKLVGDTTDGGINPAMACNVYSPPFPHVTEHHDMSRSPNVSIPVQVVMNVEKIRKWKNDEVKKWAENCDLKSCGFDNMEGIEVALLITMRREAPEFFYKCLQDMLKVKDLLIMSKIVWALHDLTNVS